MKIRSSGKLINSVGMRIKYSIHQTGNFTVVKYTEKNSLFFMIAPFNRVTFPLLKVIKSCTGTGLVSGLLVLCTANTNPPMLTMHTWADRRPWAGQVGVSATRSREAGPRSRPDLHWGSSSPGGWDGAAAARLCHIPRQEPCCTAPLFAVMSGTAWDGVGRAARAEASQKCFLHMFGTCRACHLPSAQTFWS